MFGLLSIKFSYIYIGEQNKHFIPAAVATITKMFNICSLSSKAICKANSVRQGAQKVRMTQHLSVR